MLQNIEALGIIYLGGLLLVPIMFAAKYRQYHGHWPDSEAMAVRIIKLIP